MHSPTHVTNDQVHVLLNLGSNIKTNILWPYSYQIHAKKKKDFKYKYFQNMVFYTNYQNPPTLHQKHLPPNHPNYQE